MLPSRNVIEMSVPKIAIIIDPYSSGALYAPEFAEHSAYCIAIQSSLPLPAHFLQDFDALNFIKVLSPSSSHKLALHLSARNIVAVVASCNTAIALTDKLSERLGVAGNDPSTSEIQRYKDQMHEALKSCSVQHIDTAVFRSFRELSTRSTKFNDITTFVVKPLNSAGSEGVRFAAGSQGIAEAIKLSA
jgi:hypothetical protein